MLYLGDSKLDDKDLPKRTVITEMILNAHKEEIKNIGDDLKVAVGHISFTMDLWTDPNLHPFMAITAHYYKRNKNGLIEYRSGLIVFHYTLGSHSGEELYRHLFKILEDYGVAHKVHLCFLPFPHPHDHSTRCLDWFYHNGQCVQ